MNPKEVRLLLQAFKLYISKKALKRIEQIGALREVAVFS